jgi:hypothetical protein
MPKANLKPLCKLCDTRHYSYESHKLTAGDVTPSVTPVTQAATQPPIRYAARNAEPVPVTPTVTPGEPCPTCGQVVRQHQDNASRQRAYRARRGASINEPGGGADA